VPAILMALKQRAEDEELLGYSNTAPHKYLEFKQRIDLNTLPTFDI
jgi:hypothetical protein